MPLNLEYIDDGRGIYVTLEGKVTLDDFKVGSSEAYSEEHILNQNYQIIDFTSCSSFDLSSSDMLEIAKIDKKASEFNPNIKIAIIAPSDLVFGMCRVYEAYADETGFDIMVLRTRQEAENWIQKK